MSSKNRGMRIQLLLTGLLPLAGFAMCYLFPLCLTFWNALFGGGNQLPWCETAAQVWSNRYFLLGLKNLILIGCASVSGAFLLSLLLSKLLYAQPDMARYGAALLILPLLIPSVSAVQLAKYVFHISILSTWREALLALLTLYWWKCSGVSSLLLMIALRRIPVEVFEAARLDGCNERQIYFRIQLPMISREIRLTLLFLLMYYFRIYKESYLLFGQYPPEEMYLIQHYLANQYLKMNVTNVSVASASLALICLFAFALAAGLRKVRRGV